MTFVSKIIYSLYWLILFFLVNNCFTHIFRTWPVHSHKCIFIFLCIIFYDNVSDNCLIYYLKSCAIYFILFNIYPFTFGYYLYENICKLIYLYFNYILYKWFFLNLGVFFSIDMNFLIKILLTNWNLRFIREPR